MYQEPVIVSRSNPAVKAILAMTYPTYRGRKIGVVVCDSVTFHDTNWCEGSRTQYKAIKYTAGGFSVSTFVAPAPWVNVVEGSTVMLPADCLIVAHSIFCGRDCGITIYHSAGNTLRLTPADRPRLTVEPEAVSA